MSPTRDANADETREGPRVSSPTATNRERIGLGDEEDETSTAAARERGSGNTLGIDAGGGEADNSAELLTLLRGMAGRLEGLEKSQAKMEKKTG
ncbi:hypothetical protein ON010_g9858 [Phytophthora cinnamomi]|nr:hypothetical protein ON010_g9858 [Phytophthora cinnamomi]